MRLIDVDVLLSCIEDRYTEKKDIVPNNLAEGFVQAEKLIKEQPIAYDVDKVVEELKEWSFNADINVSTGTTINQNLIVRDNAIEIVEAGGMVSEAENLDVRRTNETTINRIFNSNYYNKRCNVCIMRI